MPFDHNHHYHRLLLRRAPRGGRALDVGCGTGLFARRLARRGLTVDAFDASAEVVAQARARAAPMPAEMRPSFRHVSVTEAELPSGHYDFISCPASLHHMPFGTVAALRDALAPGGVLVVLGCHPTLTKADWALSLAAVPVNDVMRMAVAVVERLAPGRRGPAGVKAPVREPTVPLRRIREEAAELLPGCRIRRLLFWRYLLVFRKPA